MENWKEAEGWAAREGKEEINLGRRGMKGRKGSEVQLREGQFSEGRKCGREEEWRRVENGRWRRWNSGRWNGE